MTQVYAAVNHADVYYFTWLIPQQVPVGVRASLTCFQAAKRFSLTFIIIDLSLIYSLRHGQSSSLIISVSLRSSLTYHLQTMHAGSSWHSPFPDTSDILHVNFIDANNDDEIYYTLGKSTNFIHNINFFMFLISTWPLEIDNPLRSHDLKIVNNKWWGFYQGQISKHRFSLWSSSGLTS